MQSDSKSLNQPAYALFLPLGVTLGLAIGLLSACGREHGKDGLNRESGQVSAQSTHGQDETQAFLQAYHGTFVQHETGETLQFSSDKKKPMQWVRTFPGPCKLLSNGRLAWVRRRLDSDRQQVLSRASHVLLFEESDLLLGDQASMDSVDCEKLRLKLRPAGIDTVLTAVYFEHTPNRGIFIIPSGTENKWGSGQYHHEQAD